MRQCNRAKNSLTLVTTEYFHTNDVYLCTGYATSGAWLDTSLLSSATINSSEQLHNKLGETQFIQLSYRWHLRSVTSDQDATSVIALHSYKCPFMNRLSYKQLECNKFLHGSVTRYTNPVACSWDVKLYPTNQSVKGWKWCNQSGGLKWPVGTLKLLQKWTTEVFTNIGQIVSKSHEMIMGHSYGCSKNIICLE